MQNNARKGVGCGVHTLNSVYEVKILPPIGDEEVRGIRVARVTRRGDLIGRHKQSGIPVGREYKGVLGPIKIGHSLAVYDVIT